MGLVFLLATQIYRCRSVMRQDDTTSRQDDRTNRQDDRPSGQDHIMTNWQDNRTSRQGDIEIDSELFFTPIPLHRHHLFMLMTQDHPSNNYNTYIKKFNLEKLRQAVPIFIKIMERDTTKRYTMYVEKCFSKN